jgi:hypothetical protein
MTTARTCGSCTLCCRLLPTKEIEKPANVRCPHQCSKGCSIYANRPASCRLWSCQWLLGEELGERPDRSRLVVDPLPDFVIRVDDVTGKRTQLAVVQVWCSGSDRDAHRNSAFRAWLDRKAISALIRFDNRSGMLLAPPSVAGEWVEELSNFTEAEHTVEQKVAAGLSFDQPVVAMLRRLP